MLTTHRWLKTWGKKVSAYIAPTQFARSKFIEGGLSADRIRVKPHFLDHDPGVGRGEGHFAIFVGRLSQEKGLGLLLKAWEELDGTIQLIIVGDGPLAPMVEEAAGYDTTIRWLGRKNKSETYKLIGSASCLIFPSEVYETFGLTIIEAYAGGTPVIASDVGAAAELVRNGQTGFHFRNGSVDDLVRKTRFFFENSDIGAEMRQNARMRIPTQAGH
jgi:glycosyltransferase involved in cell wall biosynthesis